MAEALEIQFVKNEIEFNRLLTEKKYLMVNFTASWCGPCQASKPTVDGMYQHPKYKKIEFLRVDIDSCQAVARKYEISSVPTFLFFESLKETERVRGFSPKVKEALDALAEKANTDHSVVDRENQQASGLLGSGAEYRKEIAKFIPKGFEVVNDAIHFGELVALNIMPLYKKTSDVKLLFKPASENTTVYSDADSQALFFVPLNHICKVYSILVKISKPAALESTELDLDELADESQSPALVKVWANKPSILSFEDCTGSDALHEERLKPDLEPGWHEIKLRYVRFQSVQNLNIFVEGADEDAHTIIDKVVIVGLTGESMEHTAIQQDED
ncbi:thioredoxin-like protein [Metschnikowia bicuspidata var. bicuspidata NRRL YB-4993]|uniref:Thioredoxin-like protein n=1 Tax=Metschnikowia bicuspidata var. bicuspidata NRRL YB-4993 TaxID=869754 RepID=A0A1A0H224_9ASCO|nr:thioredoxin-like protein [Metschnikowia bicuspidata var. bicuspidata NRRL YB-4993]OBA18005.1 thioredoxin-like protein [Metschnikowia bicuspidata var. bicuspidata NRRL YB-4993]